MLMIWNYDDGRNVLRIFMSMMTTLMMLGDVENNHDDHDGCWMVTRNRDGQRNMCI